MSANYQFNESLACRDLHRKPMQLIVEVCYNGIIAHVRICGMTLLLKP
jgi:hypothetical protein